ncbi:MAG: NADH-quinone oxidoreductase subunit M, partial [Selenomonas sp.]|nr:NADH-quinone oxidoreductase subunit M [Selenomonas sp.]
MTFPILSVILLTPLVTALILALLPGRLHDTIRQLSALAMIIVTLLTLFVYADYDMALGGMQYTEYMPWITDLGVAYSLGVDGSSLPMLLLSGVGGRAAVYSSWHVEKRVKEYFVLLLLVIAGVSG